MFREYPYDRSPAARSGYKLLAALRRLDKELESSGGDALAEQLIEAGELSCAKRASAWTAQSTEEKARLLSQASLQCMTVRTLLEIVDRLRLVDATRLQVVRELAERDWDLIAELRAANDRHLGPRAEFTLIGDILPGTMGDDLDD
jgi:hypothetical protein